MGEAKRRKQLDPNFGKSKTQLSLESVDENSDDFSKEQQQLKQEFHSKGEVEGVKYVIFSRGEDRYLAKDESTPSVIRRGWCSHPGQAMKFPTFDKAHKKALEIAQDKSINLEVSELTEAGTKLMVKPKAEVKASF